MMWTAPAPIPASYCRGGAEEDLRVVDFLLASLVVDKDVGDQLEDEERE
jgi:hypothetical protein